MWPKSIAIYQFTREVHLDKLEHQLKDFQFSACGPHDSQKTGWVAPLGAISENLTHRAGNAVALKYCIESKILPNSVLKDAFNEKIDKLEVTHSRKLTKSEKDTIKDEVYHDLLPRAFSKRSTNFIYIIPADNLILVACASVKKAEDILGLLRKTIGSLPVTPLDTEAPLAKTFTTWCTEGVPVSSFSLGESATLKSLLGDGGEIGVKREDLSSDEIIAHLKNDKLATKVSLNYKDELSFDFSDTGMMTKLKFSDELQEQNDDIDREDIVQRYDADLLIITETLRELLLSIFPVIGYIKSTESK